MEMARQCNVGGTERFVRMGLGTGLIALGLMIPMNKWLAYTLETIGITGAATGIAQFCPVSKAMGRNTCTVKETLAETPVELRAA